MVYFCSILDLRSGAQKSSEVPPKRQYRKKMVVHSPPPSRKSDVPPSVRAAGVEAAASGTAGAAGGVGQLPSGATGVPVGDLLHQGQVVHDFDLWDGETPPTNGIEVQVDVNSAKQEQVDETTKRERVRLTGADGQAARAAAAEDADRISVAGSVPDVTPPPPTQASPDRSQLNPFTPEWFAQVIGAAANAAATAAVTAVTSPAARPSPAPSSATSPDPAAPRRLNDRKIPDFWEDRPEFWFKIFDAHLSHFNPSEQRCFDTLLPLLTAGARTTVHSVIRTPGPEPYSRAREALLRHFGKTPRQLARTFLDTRTLGDRLPSEYLDHIEGLLPDIKVLYQVMLLDALSPNARVAALQHSDARAMARAADAVVLENRAVSESDRSVPSVNSLSLLDSDLDGANNFPPPLAPAAVPEIAAVSRSQRPPLKKVDGLCAVHARWGKEAYTCRSPNTCKMRNVLKTPPPSSQAARGNGKAGGQ